ncbi:MAG: (4Fe-4S)-binding protein [Gelidibacter sp.]
MTKTKEYSNGEVTVVWKPELCIHSGICVKGLGDVFKPKEKPWVKVKAASTDDIINQVKECPSGALSHYMNNEKIQILEHHAEEIKVEVRENGPLVVHGTLKVIHANGTDESRTRVTTFCRCGASSNKPFCDGAHREIEFKG